MERPHRLDRRLPEPASSPNNKEMGINVDFINWPSGKYNVKFTLKSGKLKGEATDLRVQTLTTSVLVGEKIWVFDQDGQPVTRIDFDNLDRE